MIKHSKIHFYQASRMEISARIYLNSFTGHKLAFRQMEENESCRASEAESHTWRTIQGDKNYLAEGAILKEQEARENRQWAEIAVEQIKRKANFAAEQVRLKEKEAEEARQRVKEFTEQVGLRQKELEEARQGEISASEQVRLITNQEVERVK
jgi:hypothetical protein